MEELKKVRKEILEELKDEKKVDDPNYFDGLKEALRIIDAHLKGGKSK